MPALATQLTKVVVALTGKMEEQCMTGSRE